MTPPSEEPRPSISELMRKAENDPKKTVHTALLGFQADCPILIKDKKAEIVSKRTGGKFSYKFIPLPNIMETIQPWLSKHGLIWTTCPTVDERGRPALKYWLMYAPTGDMITGRMTLILGADADSRAHGSALSYGRRQALECVLNLVAQTDDDGARASGASKRPTGDARPLRKDELDKVLAAVHESGKPLSGLLTAVGVVSDADLTVGSAKAIRQILDGGKTDGT